MGVLADGIRSRTATLTDAATLIDKTAILNCGTAGGTANSLTLTSTPAFTTLTDGMCFSFQGLNYNDGATTINLNSIGAKSLVDAASHPMGGGEIIPGGSYVVMYTTSGDKFVYVSGAEVRGILKKLTTTTINNSAADTDLFNMTIKAKTLAQGRGLRLRSSMRMTNGTGGAINYTTSCKLGGTTLIQHTSAVPAGFDLNAVLDFSLIGLTIATQESFSTMLVDALAVSAKRAPATKTMSSDQTLVVSGQMASASASASFIHYATLVEWI